MTKYKSFPQKFWTQIQEKLDLAFKTDSSPIAAFDADGTLWDTDLGENFFKWQIKNCQLPNLPADPWLHYRKWKSEADPRPAYLWLAQINQGQTLTQVRSWAQQALENYVELPIFEEQRKLIDWLKSQKVEVYVVTASVKWAVEPGSLLLGIEHDNVLGITTKTDKDNKLTSNLEGLITYREGKPAALFEKTKKFPFFASGNTMGDFSLLKSATQLGLAVGATKQGHELYPTESELRSHASQNQWLVHEF